MLVKLSSRIALTLVLGAAPCLGDDFSDSPRKETEPHDVSVLLLADALPDTPTSPTPHREIVRQRYADGAIHIEKHVVQDDKGNYLNHGQWRMFDPRGAVVAEGLMQSGAKQGDWTRIVDQEAQKSVREQHPGFTAPYHSDATFVDDKLHGIWNLADHQGRPIWRIALKQGVRDGESLWYFPNGHPRRMVTYQDGVANGPCREWTADGQLTLDAEFVDGRQITVRTTNHEPPHAEQKQTEEEILSRRHTPVSRDDWWRTQEAEYEISGLEVLHGVSRTWHVNGQLIRQMKYRWGERHGYATWWYSNGQIKTQGMFRSGHEEGMWTWWHENGGKMAEGAYEKGRPTKTWRAWRDNGVLQGKLEDPYLKLGKTEYSVLKLVETDRPEAVTPSVAEQLDPAEGTRVAEAVGDAAAASKPPASPSSPTLR